MKNEAFYKQILQDAPFGFAYHEIILDKSGKPVDYCFVDVNEAFEKMTGFKAAEIKGKTAKQIFPQIDNSAFDWIKVYGEVAQSGKPVSFVQYFEPLQRWFNVEASSPAQGEFITIFTDISGIQGNELLALTRAEQSRQEGEERYAFFAKTATEMAGLATVKDLYTFTAQKIHQLLNGQSMLAIVEYDLQTNLWKTQHMVGIGKWINDLTNLLGFDLRNFEGEISTKYLDEITSGSLVELEFDFPGLFNNKISDLVGNTAKKMLGLDKMYSIAFQKGNKLFGNITFTTNKKTGTVNKGLIEAFVSMVSNFLNRLIAEEEQRKSELRYRTYVNNAPMGVFVVDQHGNYLEVNDEACRITGYAAEELLGMKFIELIDPESVESFLVHFTSVKERGRDSCEIVFRTKTGEKRWWNVVCAKLSEDQIFGLALDITERKRVENALLAKMDDLERFHKLTVGRELTMVELKKEVNSLLNKLGEEDKYKIVE